MCEVNIMEDVELIINGVPTMISKEKFVEYASDTKFRIVEKDGKKVLLERMEG